MCSSRAHFACYCLCENGMEIKLLLRRRHRLADFRFVMCKSVATVPFANAGQGKMCIVEA